MARLTVTEKDRVRVPVATPEHDVPVEIIDNLRQLPDGYFKYYNESIEDAIEEFRAKYGEPTGVWYMESKSPRVRHVYIVMSSNGKTRDC